MDNTTINSGEKETEYLLSIPGMKEALIDGKNTPIEECLTTEEIGWKLDDIPECKMEQIPKKSKRVKEPNSY